MSITDILDIDDLIMSATSYYIGRRTANVDDFCRRLVRAWPMLSGSVRGYVERVVEDAFKRDDFYRRSGSAPAIEVFPLGDNCDRASWETVRNLWSA